MSSLDAAAIMVSYERRKEGCFVASFRNRPAGHEEVRMISGEGGGLRLRARTSLTVNGLVLHQTVKAGYDCTLRPRWCTVAATINTKEMRLDLEIGHRSATVRCGFGGRVRRTTMEIIRSPLLLADNCFSTHAMAALTVRRAGVRAAEFVSIPTFDPVRAEAPGPEPVLIGGDRLARPSVSLRLAPGLHEHAWIRGPWVERLVISRLQARIEWTARGEAPGGSR